MKRVLRETPEKLARIVLDLDEKLQQYETLDDRHAAIDRYAKDLVSGGFSGEDLDELKRLSSSYVESDDYMELRPNDMFRLGILYVSLSSFLSVKQSEK